MITFYLVRHGTKENIPFDPPLTEIGIKQAEATAKYLRNISFKAIYVSQKLRARQTAQIIAKSHSLPVFTDKRLQERMEWENDKSFDEFVAEWDKTDIDRNYKPKVGLSSNNNGKQIRKVIDELANRYDEGNILVVTHGGSIGDLLRNLFTKNDFVYKTRPDSGAPYLNILECSVTVIQKKDKYKLLKLNDVSHLSIPLI
jgi:alpha-ribazole phosphatase